MNQLIHSGGKATMSSREIADLTGSTHDNVLKTIRSLIDRGVVFGNETPYTHPQNGQVYREFLLGYRDTMVVVSGYSVELRAKIIDRWQELEAAAAPAFQVPTTLSGALRLAAEQAERIEQQQALLEQQKPAVEFVGRYVEAKSGEKGVREVAKLLKANEREFVRWLEDRKIMFREGGRLTPFKDHINLDRIRLIAGEREDSGFAYTTAKFSPKGIAWIAGEWGKHQVAKTQQQQ